MHPIEWQPVSGCSYTSPGCTNCKTMKLASSAMRGEFDRDGLTATSNAGAVWTGAVSFSEARLTGPAALTQPAEFIVCPHSDLFHDNVPQAWLDRVFEQIEICPHHAFQVLTKRALRMRDYIEERYRLMAPPTRLVVGISCERQIEADQRIPLLRQTPAAWRSLTLYPLLGPIDLTDHLQDGGIDMVMAGTEEERPADPIWIEAIMAQCAAAHVPFHFSNRLIGQA